MWAQWTASSFLEHRQAGILEERGLTWDIFIVPVSLVGTVLSRLLPGVFDPLGVFLGLPCGRYGTSSFITWQHQGI